MGLFCCFDLTFPIYPDMEGQPLHSAPAEVAPPVTVSSSLETPSCTKTLYKPFWTNALPAEFLPVPHHSVLPGERHIAGKNGKRTHYIVILQHACRFSISFPMSSAPVASPALIFLNYAMGTKANTKQAHPPTYRIVKRIEASKGSIDCPATYIIYCNTERGQIQKSSKLRKSASICSSAWSGKQTKRSQEMLQTRMKRMTTRSLHLCAFFPTRMRSMKSSDQCRMKR